MPELPEVQTTASELHKLVRGLKIEDVWTDYGGDFHIGKKHIKDKKYFGYFRKNVIGAKISSVSRRGKNVLINLGKRKIIAVHMKMTGHLLYGAYRRISNYKFLIPNEKKKERRGKEMWEAEEEGPLRDSFNQFIHLVFSLSNKKHLVLSDMRKFARVTLVTKERVREELGNLGPEPLEKSFGFKPFLERLMLRPCAKIKQALLDQSLIAGIGNIYSDEMLWLSSIHPLSPVIATPEDNLRALYHSMKKILNEGIDFRGDSTSDYRHPSGEKGQFQYRHQAYRQTGKKCPKPRCRGTIKRIVIGARSTHFCDRHQHCYNE